MTYFNEKTGQFDLDAYTKQGASASVTTVKNTIAKNFTADSKETGAIKTNKKFDASKFEFTTDV